MEKAASLTHGSTTMQVLFLKAVAHFGSTRALGILPVGNTEC